MANRPYWQAHELKPIYDVVILGAGVHGLAIAYALAKQGITGVAVIDDRPVGATASARTSVTIGARSRPASEIDLFYESIAIYESLARELGFPFTFEQIGHLLLSQSERDTIDLRERGEIQEMLGLGCQRCDQAEIAKLEPGLDVSERVRRQIALGLYTPRGGYLHRDELAWAFAQAADRLGVEIHPQTEVTAIHTSHGSVAGVATSRGAIAAPTVVLATSGQSSAFAKMAGLELPLATFPLQRLITEQAQPCLNHVVESATLHLALHQNQRGEIVIDSSPRTHFAEGSRPVLRFLEDAASHAVELFPYFAKLKILRQNTGTCEHTPDRAPIIGAVEGIEGLILDLGWGDEECGTAPAVAQHLAKEIVTNVPPEILRPFTLARFGDGVRLLDSARSVFEL